MSQFAPLARRRIKEIRGLHRRRQREALGQFVVEGIRSVESAVEAGAHIVEIVVTHEAVADARVAAIVARAEVPVYAVAAIDLERMADTQSAQGVLVVATLHRAEPGTLPLPIVALDGVQDPGNVGAIIRSAAWFGAAGILTGPETADPFGPKAVRAAMGGLWDIQMAETDDLAQALRDRQDRGARVFGAGLEGADVSEWRPPRNSVLVIGSEAHGLSRPVQTVLESYVHIGGGEHRRGVESLNAAVAAGILLHRWLGLPQRTL